MDIRITKQTEVFILQSLINEKSQEARCLVAKLIAQRRKSRTAGENLIMPLCKIIVIKTLGQDAIREFGKVLLSNGMIIDILISCHIILKKFLLNNLKINSSFTRLMSPEFSPVNVML